MKSLPESNYGKVIVIILFYAQSLQLGAIKRHPNILISINQFTHCFTIQTSYYDVIFDICVDTASLATSFKKCNVIMT